LDEKNLREIYREYQELDEEIEYYCSLLSQIGAQEIRREERKHQPNEKGTFSDEFIQATQKKKDVIEMKLDRYSQIHSFLSSLANRKKWKI